MLCPLSGSRPRYAGDRHGRDVCLATPGRWRTGRFGRSKCQNGHSRLQRVVAAVGPSADVVPTRLRRVRSQCRGSTGLQD